MRFNFLILHTADPPNQAVSTLIAFVRPCRGQSKLICCASFLSLCRIIATEDTKRLLFSFVRVNLTLSPGVFGLFSAYLYLNENCQCLGSWEQGEDNLLSFVLTSIFFMSDHERQLTTCGKKEQTAALTVPNIFFIPLWIQLQLGFLKIDVFTFINNSQLDLRVSKSSVRNVRDHWAQSLVHFCTCKHVF